MCALMPLVSSVSLSPSINTSYQREAQVTYWDKFSGNSKSVKSGSGPSAACMDSRTYWYQMWSCVIFTQRFVNWLLLLQQSWCHLLHQTHHVAQYMTKECCESANCCWAFVISRFLVQLWENVATSLVHISIQESSSVGISWEDYHPW